MIWVTKSMGLILLGLSTVICSHLAFAEHHQENIPGDAPIPEFDCVIEPSEIVDVGSADPGVIERIDVQRNDRVKKEEVIATLESSVEQATLKLAKTRASLNTAIELRRQSAEFGSMTQQRNQALVQKAAISRQDMDQLRTETRIAELRSNRSWRINESQNSSTCGHRRSCNGASSAVQ
jgi:multidrug efflux pump subunit AcrA (membrane-fusion protein)